MATYKYQAFDKTEKKVSGIISASDTIEARNILISRELNPLKIVPGKENKSKTKISQKELSIFTKQLSALLSAGTPLETSLMLLSQQAKSKFTNVLLEINDDITEGKGLSESMKKFPQIFDDIYTSTIFAGESSASLPQTRDFIRGVSEHVSIGAAYKKEKAMGVHFILCRDDVA